MANIVVLEDDASTRRLICAVLKKSGHQVTDVDNGAEGLLIVMAEQPDLVISDVDMPKMTGFEVLQNMRLEPETAHTPVILLTALSSQADVREGMSHGAADYITKPFEPARLIAAVDAQLATLPNRRGIRSPAVLDGFEATRPGDLSLEPFPAIEPQREIRTESEVAPALSLVPANVETTAAQLPRVQISKAWAVNLSVQNAAQMQQALPVKDWRSLLRQLFVPVSKDAALRIADYLDLQGSNLTLYFVDRGPNETAHLPAGRVRAAQAVESMVRSAAQAKLWAAQQFHALNAPMARIVVSLHMGPLDIVRVPLDFGGERDTVLGPTADYIARVREGEPSVMWRVLATGPAIAESAGFYKLGANLEVSVGSQEMAVHAVQGLAAQYSQGAITQPADWI
jgi:DNA-binding response OmpR family regulator